MKTKVVSIVIASLVLAAFLPLGTVGAEEVTIGVLYPFSGDLGVYGESETDAMKLAVKEVNENGGVLGGRLRLVIKDTESSGVVAVEQVHKLVEWYNVSTIIGPAGSETCDAIINYTTKKDVLLISPSVTATKFTDYKDNDFFFRTCPSDKLQGIAMARLAIQQGHKTASTLVIWNIYGTDFEKAFTKEFQTLGGKVLESVKYDPGAATFNSKVEKVAAVNPDFVMLCAYPETGSSILKTAYEEGYMDNIDWLLTEGLMTDELADMVGKDKDGNYIVARLKGTATDPRVVGPAYDTFKRNYTAEYGIAPTGYCANSYDAVAVVALAIENAGDSSGTAIRNNLRTVANPPAEKDVSDIGEALRTIRKGLFSINYQGASGKISFNEKGDVDGSYCEWTISDDGSIILGSAIVLSGPIVVTTPSPTAAPTATATPTAAPTATATPTAAPTATATPIVTSTPTSTPEASAPGFEAVFAIAGVLAIAYLLRRRG